METQPTPSDLETGRIVFAYLTQNQFAMIGDSLKKILTKEPLTDRDLFRPVRGTKREEYSRYTALVADLSIDQLKNLGYRPPSLIDRARARDNWTDFHLGSSDIIRSGGSTYDFRNREDRWRFEG